MNIAERIVQLRASLPNGVKLIAVSKFQPEEAIMEAYEAGQRCFGESRAQELKTKAKALPEDIEWHFIGNLQTNKVKDVVPYAYMIHSVSSLKLLQEIEKESKKTNRSTRVLLEVYIAQEYTKHGLAPLAWKQLFEENPVDDFMNVRFCGLMGMASNTDNAVQVRSEFGKLAGFFAELKDTTFKNNVNFKELSMGMSQDYQIALPEGSTMIRVGSAIFGERE